ncbi:MAG TPA: hypothetical protein VGK81_11145 [Anaerolineae bacterium]
MADTVLETPAPRPEGAESPAWIIGLLVVLVTLGVFIVTLSFRSEPAYQLWLRLLGVLVIVTIFSILYKDNPVFRFVEHLYIGLATGYGLIYTWVNVAEPKWFIPMMPSTLTHGGQGHWTLFFAFLLGLLFFTVYFPKLAWMNRFAIGVLMGFFSGMALQMFMGGLAPQLVAAFRPPVTKYSTVNGVVSPTLAMNNIHVGSVWLHPWALLALVVLLCTLAYFFFSIEHRTRWIRVPSNFGRYFLMITLGAIFGTTVMGRLSLLIERLGFLIGLVKDYLPHIAR